MVAVTLAFLALVARLWYLQIYLGDDLRQLSEVNRTRLLRIQGPRGLILDAKGRILADTRQAVSLAVMPDYETVNPHLLERLAPIIGIDENELKSIVERGRANPYDPIRVSVDVDLDMLARVEEQRPYLAGLAIQPSNVRHYPDGKIVAHVLGPLGEADADDLKMLEPYGYKMGDYVGKGGIERTYNRYLGGVAGGDLVEVDARGRVTRLLYHKPTRVGCTLRTALNMDVQRAAIEAMAGRPGAAVALDPRDGGVIALASSPTYDANLFARRVKPDVWRALTTDPRRPLLNRAVNSAHPPGSTFKIVTATAGIYAGKIIPETHYYCGGGMVIGGRFKHCWARHSDMNLLNAIAQSCDSFFYHASLAMGIQPLVQIARAYGLGAKSGIDLPSESRGNIPHPRERSTPGHPRNWWPGDTANAAIGQGAILTTPLQMAMVAAAAGNGGTVYRPHIMRQIISPDGRVVERAKPQVVSKLPVPLKKLEWVRQGMRQAVLAGTCRGANLPNVAVAGKTGSAQATGSRKTHGWFICFAPYDHPTIAIAVVLEKAGHGGTVAVPVARKMLEAYFGLKTQRGETVTRTD
jgi:penicillin-binding protein 2